MISARQCKASVSVRLLFLRTALQYRDTIFSFSRSLVRPGSDLRMYYEQAEAALRPVITTTVVIITPVPLVGIMVFPSTPYAHIQVGWFVILHHLLYNFPQSMMATGSLHILCSLAPLSE
jgi:hypothetical protein